MNSKGYTSGANMVPLVAKGLDMALDGDALFTVKELPLPPLKPARAVLYMFPGYADDVDPLSVEQLHWAGVVRYAEASNLRLAGTHPVTVIEEHRHDLQHGSHVHQSGMCRSFKLRHDTHALSGVSKLEAQQSSERLAVYVAALLKDTFLRPGQTAPFDPLHPDMRPSDMVIRWWKWLGRKKQPLFFNNLLSGAAQAAIRQAYAPHPGRRPAAQRQWYSEGYDPARIEAIRRMVSPTDAA